MRRVGVVNREFGRRFFGDASPIGRTVKLDYLARPPLDVTDNGFEIVGVIDDLRNVGAQRATMPEIYVPYGVNALFSYLIVEGRVPPRSLERSVRAEVYALDPQQPVTLVSIYRVTATGSVTVDSVKYDNGAGVLVKVTTPALPWTVNLAVPAGSTIEAHAWGTSGAGSSTARGKGARYSRSASGRTSRREAVGSP